MCQQAMARIQRPCIVRSWTRVTEPCSQGEVKETAAAICCFITNESTETHRMWYWCSCSRSSPARSHFSKWLVAVFLNTAQVLRSYAMHVR